MGEFTYVRTWGVKKWESLISKAELKISLNKWSHKCPAPSVLVGYFSTSVSYLTINSLHAESLCLMVAIRATKELLTPTQW